MEKIGLPEWKQLFPLLDEVLEVPPAEREAWIDTLQGRDELKPLLRELLSRHASRETNDFLRDVPKFTHVEGGAAPAGRPLQAGDQVGPYRLLRELGVGGMGSVWLAERADGAFKRTLALKLPHVNWSGSLVERLAREREILAGLEHPNIARLYDAGVDELGRPFMAMEYVEGRPIDEHCRERNLGIRERLALVLQVAAAVAHAHTRLVVHRDLKPGNILVSSDGAVHLLDFGIAKLLAGDSARETRLTALAGRALTLDYASPEQIKGEPVTTATDVYSLAVVAYELLAAARPYKLKRQSAAELEQAIADVDPLPASGAAQDPMHKRQLRGDLDAILNKAMKKDPHERYATVDAFAQDIDRHLRGVPVLAHPDKLSYRVGKFVTRNRGAVVAGSAVIVAIVAGAAVALWQAREADAQAQLARVQATRASEQANRAEEVKRFVLSIFENADFDAGANRETTAVDLLKRAEQRVDKELQDDPAVAVELMTSIGYSLIGLAQEGEAITVLQRAVALGDRALGKENRLTTGARVTLGEALIGTGQLPEADSTLTAAIDTARRIDAPRELADGLRWLSDLRVKQGRDEDGLVFAEEAGRIADTRLTSPADAQLRMEVYINLSDNRRTVGRTDGLEPAKRARDMAEEMFADRPSLSAYVAHLEYARQLSDTGELDAAQREFEHFIAQAKALRGGSNAMLASDETELSLIQLARGDPIGALATLREVELEDAARRNGGAFTRQDGVTELALTLALLDARREAEAETKARAAVQMLTSALGRDVPVTMRARMHLGYVLVRLNRLDPAQTELASLRPSAGSTEEATLALRTASLRHAQGQLPEAARLFAQAITGLEKLSPAPRNKLSLARALVLSAECLLDLKQPDAAAQALDRAQEVYAALHRNLSPDAADALTARGRVFLATNRPQDALEVTGKAATFWKRFDADNRYAGIAFAWHSIAARAAHHPEDAADSLARARAVLSRSRLPADQRLLSTL